MRNFAQLQEFSRMREISRSCRNFRTTRNFAQLQQFSCMREIFLLREILCFLFSAQNDSVLLIFFFALDVILLTWAFLVFHFIARLYIAILCTVNLTNDWIGKNTGALFLFSAVSLSLSLSIFFFHFLSLSRQPNTPLRMTTQGMLGETPSSLKRRATRLGM